MSGAARLQAPCTGHLALPEVSAYDERAPYDCPQRHVCTCLSSAQFPLRADLHAVPSRQQVAENAHGQAQRVCTHFGLLCELGHARLQHVCVIPAAWPSIAAEAHSGIQVGHHGVPTRADVLADAPRIAHLASTRADKWLLDSPL